MYPDMETAIDGGIKEGNVAEAARTGVDIICVGSAIYRQEDPGACFRHLQALAEANAP
jgi:ribulose-phosphate 3-epimerase